MTEPEGGDRSGGTTRVLGLDVRRFRRWLSWRSALLGLVGAGVVVGAAAALFVVAGGVDISADAPDGPLATGLLHFVFKRSTAAAAGRVTPPADLSSPSRVRLAAQHFDLVCANCHGRPGFGQSVTALSMSPRPQYLPKVVGQFTDAQLYEIVEHGVKYSAMPAWATPGRGDEVWSMVAFLRQLPKLDAGAYREMTTPAKMDAALATTTGDAVLQPANARRNAPPMDEFLYAAPAAGFGDPAIRADPVATCARCHGPDGSGAVTGGEAPNLTLQDPAYLKASLSAYVSGERKSGYMQTIAAQLSTGQIAALSAYYASLPVKATPPSPTDPALARRGETVATLGLPQRAIPACATCHEGPGAAVIGAPRIAGQSATYLRRQLFAMAQGGRGSGVAWNPMSAVAHDISDADITALAAYYSSLPPTKGAGAAQAAPPPVSSPSPADLQAAKALFEARCMKCHVNGGRGDVEGNYPDLTLQTRTYVAQNLHEFHAGLRQNDKMQQVAGDLDFPQMAALAAYVEGLTPLPAVTRPDAQAAQRGAALATQGAPGRGIPACVGCHDARSVAALPLIPALNGQHAAYLRRKLAAFAAPNGRDRSGLNPMPGISNKLTEGERADLAAYFAAQPPLQKAAR